MATLAEFNQEHQDEDQNSPDTPPAAGGDSSEVVESGSGGGSAAPAGGGSAPRANPSGKPNVQQYLQANQGGNGQQSAGEQLSGTIQKNVQGQANQLGEKVNTATSQLGSQYDPLNKNLSTGKDTIDKAFKDPQALLDAYNQSKSTNQAAGTTQPAASPTAPTNQPAAPAQDATQGQQQAEDPNAAPDYSQMYNQFQQLNTGGYGTDINNLGQAAQTAVGDLQTQYGDLAQQTNAAKNEMGRFSLLRNAVGQPNYTSGQQTLDSLFLQAQPGVTRGLQNNLGQIAQGAQSNIQGLASQYDPNSAESKIAALQNLSAQNQDYAKTTFNTGLGDITSTAQAKMAADQAKAGQLPDVIKRLQGNTTTAADAQALGLKAGTSAYDVDLSKFINQQAPTETLAQAATPEDFARYNALRQLGGIADPSAFGTATTAGGYDPYQFQQTAADAAIGKAKDYYENQQFHKVLDPWTAPASGGDGSIFHGTGHDGLNAAIGNLKKAKSADDLAGPLAQALADYNAYYPGDKISDDKKLDMYGLGDAKRYYDKLMKMRGNIIANPDTPQYSSPAFGTPGAAVLPTAKYTDAVPDPLNTLPPKKK